MTSQTIAVIGGIVLPLLVAIVTRADAPPAVKAVVNGLLAAVAAWVATVIPGTPIDLKSALVTDRKSTRLNSSHVSESRMPSSA